mgnify:CR=1 FL=1
MKPDAATSQRRQSRRFGASGRTDFTQLMMALRASVGCVSRTLTESRRSCAHCATVYPSRFTLLDSADHTWDGGTAVTIPRDREGNACRDAWRATDDGEARARAVLSDGFVEIIHFVSKEPTLVCGLWGTAGGPAGCSSQEPTLVCGRWGLSESAVFTHTSFSAVFCKHQQCLVTTNRPRSRVNSKPKSRLG